MWILFSVLTVLLWGISDVIFKRATDEDEESILRLLAYNGIMLGISGVIYMLFRNVTITFNVILTYLPVASCYIISMYFYYKALRYIKVSLVSPIGNASCALTSLLCVLFLKQEVNLIQIFAIVLIATSIILLSINKDEIKEMKVDKKSKNENLKKIYKAYVIGILCSVMYLVLDGVGSFLDESVLTENLLADEVIVSMAYIYFAVGIVSYIILKIKNKEYKINLDKKKFIGAIFETLGEYTYVYAFALGNAVIISPFVACFCVVSIILSRIFLKEKLTKVQYALITSIVIGMIILSL